MGANQAIEVDAWLREGGVVVTASDRAARAIAGEYHRGRLAEGQTAWATPRIQDWLSFARAEWDKRNLDGRMVLNSFQERAMWVDIVSAAGHAAATLAESRHRLAAMAMEAHALICSYAPRLLNRRARGGWSNDAAAFSEWLASFDEACGEEHAVSASRVAIELVPLLERESAPRAPLMLAGFDRLLPLQQALFDAWGDWQRLDGGSERAATHFYAARDAESELAACAIWCNNRLADEPASRILVLTQDAAKRRGEIERAFLEHCGQAATARFELSPRFEFSLGVPLGGVAIARVALLLLRWLDEALEEHQLDWLIGTSHSAAALQETATLQARMRDLRRQGLQRARWELGAFLRQRAKTGLPPAWVRRMTAAQRRLDSLKHRDRNPVEWAEIAPILLKEIGWPGESASSSAEFQAAQRLQQVFELCGSLGFNGRTISWNEFLGELNRALAETLFSPESQGAPILIAGAAESAGLTADAIWFLGADEDTWPARGSLHPLLPAAVQRETRMPHASPQLDWDLARAVTTRLITSARQVCFSHASQTDGADVQPSRVVAQLVGNPGDLPVELLAPPTPAPLATWVEDQSLIPLTLIPQVDRAVEATDSGGTGSPHKIRGGSEVLTAQSQCAFKAFAIARLGAKTWEPAEVALSASQRGRLLHAVMHAVWAGPPKGIRTLDELLGVADRREFVAALVSDVMDNELPDAARELMPHRYLELEATRLANLVSEWLNYEAARAPFTVIGTELNKITPVADVITLDLRLDRIDRLNDGSLLVIDYKTGAVSPKSWDPPRPEDVQLPLYGGYGLENGEELGGMVFAKIRAGDLCFTGRVGNPVGTLGIGLQNIEHLKRNPLSAEGLMDWRETIEQLARDFVAGRADVDPLDTHKTCSRCGLHTLCRIQEQQIDAQDDEAEDVDE